jgi:hypothetical protein
MSTTHASLEESLGDFERARTDVVVDGLSSEFFSTDAAGMVDFGVLDVAAAMANFHRSVDAPRVIIAGEIAHRSQLSLGTDGMARRAGNAKPSQLVAEMFGITVGRRSDCARSDSQPGHALPSTGRRCRPGIRWSPRRSLTARSGWIPPR